MQYFLSHALEFFTVHGDKVEKKGIFDRLEKTKNNRPQPRIEVTGLDKVHSSIFARLGGKSDDMELDEDRAVAFSGILKSAPKKVSFCHQSKLHVGSLN